MIKLEWEFYLLVFFMFLVVDVFVKKKIVLFYKLYKFMNIKYIVLLDLFSVLFYSRKVNILYFSMVCLLVKIFLYIFGI